jgi:hypothetical protein
VSRPLQLLLAVAALAVIGYVGFEVWRDLSGSRLADQQSARDRQAIGALCRDVQNAFATGGTLPRGLSREEAARLMAKCGVDGYL